MKTNGYNLPDQAQKTIEGYYVKPNFIYSAHSALTFIDGSHYETETQKSIDQQKTQELEDAGFVVIRFPKERNGWHEIIRQHPAIFSVDISSN